MGSIFIKVTDRTGDGVEVLELAIRNAGDWRDFWGNRNSPMSRTWAKSRQDMFLSQGASTGTPWPKYTALETKYWLPIKRWALGMKKIDSKFILRWDKTPTKAVGAHERLYPSFSMVNHPEYVWEVKGNRVTMGSNVPYASNHNNGTGAYVRKVSAASVQRAIDKGNAALAKSAKAKDLAALSKANRRAERFVRIAKDKLGDHKKGAISIPTPKRPLVTFGEPFIADLRYALGVQASAMGGKVGILDSEYARRFKLNGGKIGL